jgi:predicted permease
VIESLWERSRRFWRVTVQRDVDDEVAFHFQMRVDQFMAGGMSRADAERAARERFGDVGEVRTELIGIGRRARRKRDIRESLHVMWQDVVVSFRSLRREPLFTFGLIITLGLGVGANATMFGVIDRLMLRGPEHVVDSKHVERLYITVNTPANGVRTTSAFGYVTYAALRDRAKSFQGIGAYASGNTLYGTGSAARTIDEARATWDLFPMLGVRPALGRFFDGTEDHQPRGEQVVVLSNEFWQSEFGGDPHVLGRRISLNDAFYSVIGVAPAGFTGPERDRVDVWRPMSLYAPRPDWPTTYKAEWLRVVARLKPSVSPEAAGAEATSILRGAYAGDRAYMHELTASVRPLWFGRSGIPTPTASVSRWLMGVAVVVLLITGANVANLLLARTRRRRREIAVRLALGVGRSGLVRLLLTETMLVSLGGAIAAVAVAAAGGRLMRVTLLSNVAWSGSPIDARVFAFTLLIAIGVGLLVGLGPALEATRLSLTRSLKTGNGEGGGQRQSVRTALSVVQSAFSVMLLIGAALFVVSLMRVRSVDLGFQPSHVIRADPRIVATTPPPADWKAQRDRIFNETLARMQRLPWVEHAAISVGTPYGFGFTVGVGTPGRDSLGPVAGGGPYISAVSSDYFRTLGIALRRGRGFTPEDRAGSAPVTIVGETMARNVWPGEEPLGKCLIIGDKRPNAPPLPCSTVVGVVADVHRESVREPATMQYYIPLGQEAALGFGGSVLVVRPRIAMPDARAALHREMAAMPEFSYTNIETIQESIDPEFRPWELGAAMFGVFGLLALIVAAVGLYSVIAYLVADRTRELGVRLALGATGGRVVREVVGRGVATSVIGVAAGTLGALAAGRFIQPMLFNISAHDPLVLVAVGALVIVIAAVAAWGPARRAGRVDPVIALRAD